MSKLTEVKFNKELELQVVIASSEDNTQFMIQDRIYKPGDVLYGKLGPTKTFDATYTRTEYQINDAEGSIALLDPEWVKDGSVTLRPIPDAASLFTRVGTYAVTWEKDGRRKTVQRWFNTVEEMDRVLAKWHKSGHDIKRASYMGN